MSSATSQESKQAPSSNSNSNVRHVSCPLIVTVGISDYKGQLPELIGINRDYCNIIYALNYKHGYHVAYFKQSDKTETKTKLEIITKQILCTSDIYDKFKTTWTREDIILFNTNIVKYLTKNPFKHNYDALFYFLSCHGDVGDTIIDSDCNNIKFSSIVDTFNNTNCPALSGKPKIFFGDFCRGGMVSKRKTNETFTKKNKNDTPNATNKKENENRKEEKTQQRQQQQQQQQTKEDEKEKEKAKEKEKRKADISEEKNNSTVSESSDIRVIFSNTNGYATVDGGVKGGYLIRYFCKTLMNINIFNKCDLNEQINVTRKVEEKKIGNMAAHVIDDWNRLSYNIKLVDNEQKEDEFENSKSKNESEKEKYLNFTKTLTDTSMVKPYELTNPLIVMIGIGKYNKTDNKDLSDIRQAVKYNYKNVLNAFGRVVVMNKKQQLQEIQLQGKEKSPKFKLEWTLDEIDTFCDEIVKRYLTQHNNKNNSYNGLMFIISGHGTRENDFFDSNGEEYNLAFLFDKFDNQNCQYLRYKPKIFIIDCERGDKKQLLVNQNVNFNDQASDSDNQSNNNGNNNSNNNTDNNDKENDNTDVENNNKEHDNSKFNNRKYYMKDDHFRKIYATPEGYTIGPYNSKKGTNLIYCFFKVSPQLKNTSLTEIVLKAQEYVTQMSIDAQNNQDSSGAKYGQQIVDNNRMPQPIKLNIK